MGKWNTEVGIKQVDKDERKGKELYLTVILRGRARYELIYITNEAIGRVGYYQLISGKSEKNNCFSKFSSNSLDFFGWNLLKSWHFLYRRRCQKIFSDLQNFSTRNEWNDIISLHGFELSNQIDCNNLVRPIGLHVIF